VATPAQPNYGNIEQDIRQGLLEQEGHVQENSKLLDDALAAVNQALSVSHGDTSARSDAAANRLKAVILYYKGIAERLNARLYRIEGEQWRGDLVELAAQAAEARAAATQEAEQGIDRRVEELRAEAARVEAALAEDRTALTSLDERIHDIEGRLAQAKGVVEKTRLALDALRAEGVNLADPTGADAFAKRFEETDAVYRAAASETQALEYGGLPEARLQPPGDFLNGRFVEGGATTGVTSEFGLTHYRDERAVLTARVSGREAEWHSLRDDITHLDASKTALRDAQRRGEEKLRTLAESASKTYAELNRVDSEAFAVEDRAIQFLDQSAKASQAAAQAADDRVSQASAATRDLTPESKERSAFNMRSRDGWMGAHIAAQEADARLAIASIEYDRFRSYAADADVLGKITEYFTLAEVDVEAERIKAEDAKNAGIESVTGAMTVLERAHTRAERHWTIAAQAAEATYFLAMFGREDYVPEAIEAYRKAVSGRESEAFAKPFVARLNRIEGK